MKKVVEKVQRENEQLKKASGILTSEKMANIEMENEKLKVIFLMPFVQNVILIQFVFLRTVLNIVYKVALMDE